MATRRFESSFEIWSAHYKQGMSAVEIALKFSVHPDTVRGVLVRGGVLFRSKQEVADAKMISRFWKRVDKTNDCWLWKGGTDRAGYGVVRRAAKPIRAHRLSWSLLMGEMPPSEVFVLHKCDTPRCVRPDHLFLGSAKDNSDDMVAKGRHATGNRSGPCKHRSSYVGASNGAAKLTQDDVDTMRAMRSSGAKLKAIAVRFLITIPHASLICRGLSWSDSFTKPKE